LAPSQENCPFVHLAKAEQTTQALKTAQRNAVNPTIEIILHAYRDFTSKFSK
jgi:cyclopropane fatty-acyl-phospholipid synthase-like methyltransferase